MVKLNRKTINKYYNILRGLEKEKAEDEMNKIEHGEVEIDESYFGARRVRGKRGRGAGNKVPVFGLLKRDGLVYTEVVKNCGIVKLIVSEVTDKSE